MSVHGSLVFMEHQVPESLPFARLPYCSVFWFFLWMLCNKHSIDLLIDCVLISNNGYDDGEKISNYDSDNSTVEMQELWKRES